MDKILQKIEKSFLNLELHDWIIMFSSIIIMLIFIFQYEKYDKLKKSK